jgi:hypothetical protein
MYDENGISPRTFAEAACGALLTGTVDWHW